MKLTYTIILCLVFTSIFAQENYNLSLGGNFIIDYRQDKISTTGLVKLVHNTAITPAGKISGNFAGKEASFKRQPINGNKYWYKPAIIAANNKLSIHCADQEFCFTTNPIDISKSSTIGFEVIYSGKGSLDTKNPSDDIIWRDWLDFICYIDGQRVNSNVEERIDGLVHYNKDGVADTKYSKQNIDVSDGKEFQIEICMKNTGHDEWYTIENIEITKDNLWEIDLPDVNVAAPKLTHSQKVIECAYPITAQTIEIEEESNSEFNRPEKRVDHSPALSVFPNPTSDVLELKNVELYDLNSILILDATGKLMNKTSTYPIDLSKLPAGTYLISVKKKVTEEQVSTFFVVVNR